MFGSAGRQSLSSWIMTMVLMTGVAAGVGWLLGMGVVGHVRAFDHEQAHLQTGGPAARYGQDVSLMDLPPIIANLTDPQSAWVRLQASIVYDTKQVPKPQMLAATISEDILAYMKTLSLAQIGGASGLEHLREDLNERAAIRSDGHVHELIIETLVVQ